MRGTVAKRLRRLANNRVLYRRLKYYYRKGAPFGELEDWIRKVRPRTADTPSTTPPSTEGEPRTKA